MIEIFHGDNESAHDAFQAWRSAHPNGFHLTDKGRGVFSAHWTQDKRENDAGRGCGHQGTSDIAYSQDKNGCCTAAKKICSDSFKELCEWAASQGLTVKRCAHCNSNRFPFPAVVTGKVGAVSDAEVPAGNHHPIATSTNVNQYARDEAVRAWVLNDAAGVCACCASSAPFRGVNGQPFLEVHHVRRLTDGGTDTVSNTVALCPNCHKQLHHGMDAPQLVGRLYAQNGRLIKE